MPSAVTGIILAGGKGVRFGADKALVAMNGRSLLEIVFDRFQGLFDEILISVNEPSRYDFPGVKVVKDLLPHRGPLAGIYACLKESSHELNFVSACDMPFIQPPLIDYMIQKSPGHDVVVPSFGEGMLEPLHALYRKSCLQAMEKALETLEAQKTRVVSFYQEVRVYHMKKEEMLPYDPSLISCFNINMPEDLVKAKSLLMLI